MTDDPQRDAGPGRGDDKSPEPRVHPSSPGLLIAAGLVGGLAGWVVFDRFYGDLPSLPMTPALTLVLLAIVEGLAAAATRRRIDRQPGTEPVDPLVVARYVLVAKASAAAGAIFTGGYAGALIWLLDQRSQLAAAGRDVVPALAGMVGAALLLAAALWLEHSCRIPDPPDDEPPPARDSG